MYLTWSIHSFKEKCPTCSLLIINKKKGIIFHYETFHCETNGQYKLVIFGSAGSIPFPIFWHPSDYRPFRSRWNTFFNQNCSSHPTVSDRLFLHSSIFTQHWKINAQTDKNYSLNSLGWNLILKSDKEWQLSQCWKRSAQLLNF